VNVTVVGASRYEQKITEAPSYASILTAEDIKRTGTGLWPTCCGRFRGSTPRTTGFSRPSASGASSPRSFNSRILLLGDGHVVNNSVYEHAPAGNDFPVDIDLVERVEVVRGPSSSLYGAKAFFGVINVITKRAGTSTGAKSPAARGAGGRSRAVRRGEGFSGGPEILVSGSAGGSRGQDLYFPELDNTTNNNGVAENDDNDKYRSLFAKASWGDFTLEAVRGYRKKDMPTGQYFTAFNDDRTHTENDSGYLDLRYEKTWRAARTSLSGPISTGTPTTGTISTPSIPP
jgi:iron complex outermembrane receptor protein